MNRINFFWLLTNLCLITSFALSFGSTILTKSREEVRSSDTKEIMLLIREDLNKYDNNSSIERVISSESYLSELLTEKKPELLLFLKRNSIPFFIKFNDTEKLVDFDVLSFFLETHGTIYKGSLSFHENSQLEISANLNFDKTVYVLGCSLK
jgi:hypothetical protein